MPCSTYKFVAVIKSEIVYYNSFKKLLLWNIVFLNCISSEKAMNCKLSFFDCHCNVTVMTECVSRFTQNFVDFFS